MEYQILSSMGKAHHEVLYSLSKRVNEYIANGYRPQGGITIANMATSGIIASQAMIKTKSER